MLNLFIALFLTVWSAFAIDFDHYHSVNEINQYLREIAKEHPQIAAFRILGKSEQGREISYVVLSRGNPSIKSAIYFNGTHHGDEKSSTEAVLGLINYIIKNQNDERVENFLNSYALYFQPLVNPDGHAMHTRGNYLGIDPNRDYSSPEKNDEESFQLPEIRLVRSLVDKIKFRGALAYHSGITEVLWPWCYTSDYPKDDELFREISRQTAYAMGMDRYLQSFFDYPTNGEFIDYVYWKHGTVALTVEISKTKTPEVSELPQIIHNTVQGALKFMELLQKDDQGTLLVMRP
jgi:hypothetical protein